jgi:hypothetical protein
LPAYLFGTLLGGVLAGFVCKYLVMPSVPDYYDNLLDTYREDISRKLTLLSGNSNRDNDLTLTSNYLPLAEELSDNKSQKKEDE